MNSETYPLQALSYPFILSEYDNIIIFIKCQPITEASRQNKKRGSVLHKSLHRHLMHQYYMNLATNSLGIRTGFLAFKET